ncbi:LysM peptidoglycan-binding domain-containing protein [Caloramator proteoclasticus]|uniref:LysM domain-containing protein n=1 Tax=Caloramator proteoclasticus DSM 10124 TaxID=1121262 RepID=A0A1M4ZHA4_9CLOT|nr:LysM peptidoglycan-binding domain-containing protein [Caloramator proteoclasticus]SHF17338.1 LysM domain-containing protein [Caloramator proteoclasticus DSM 10124]
MKRKKLLFILAICIVSSFTIISIINRTYATKKEKNLKYEIYIVQQGDTLWKIAKRYTDGDPRRLIYEIRKHNDISPIIRPGQEIKIPVRKLRK